MEYLFDDFDKAVKNLDLVLQQPKTEYIRDSAIKRFELCFDLAWKSIQQSAKHMGLECNSPRGCFKTAFQLKLIDYDENWLEMIDDRNAAVHIYHEELADELYGRLGIYLEMFKVLKKKFKE